MVATDGMPDCAEIEEDAPADAMAHISQLLNNYQTGQKFDIVQLWSKHRPHLV